MDVFFWIIGSTVLVSLISFIGVFFLAVKSKTLKKILLMLVGFSAGGLIGGAFLHLLPEALEKAVSTEVFLYLLVGFSMFFMLEKIWRHCHKTRHVHVFTYLNLVGDGIHNFIDGLIISGSFVNSISLGITTTLAVVFHEIPQEIGDFGILIYGGFSRLKALAYNFFSALTAVFGAVVGYFFSIYIQNFIVFLLPFAAGGFIYIASADLIPELHKEVGIKKSLLSFIFFLIGILFMLLIKLVTQ